MTNYGLQDRWTSSSFRITGILNLKPELARDIPCLRLKLQNGNEEIILLLGYSLKQLDLLEKAIKIGNQNITFTNGAKSVFKK